MTRMLLQTIEQIGREKNIPPDVIIEAVEEAMAVASKKFFKTEEDLRATLNRDTGEVEVFAVKQVVDDVVDAGLEISASQALSSTFRGQPRSSGVSPPRQPSRSSSRRSVTPNGRTSSTSSWSAPAS